MLSGRTKPGRDGIVLPLQDQLGSMTIAPRSGSGSAGPLLLLSLVPSAGEARSCPGVVTIHRDLPILGNLMLLADIISTVIIACQS